MRNTVNKRKILKQNERKMLPTFRISVDTLPTQALCELWEKRNLDFIINFPRHNL